MIEDYDLVVLGSGAGGKLLSWTLASKGQRVAVIERRYVGGSCPNIACLPSKNVAHSAKVASYLGRPEFGLSGTIDVAAVRERKRRMVDGLVAIHLQKYQESGAELVMGSGRFIGPKTLDVTLNAGGTRTLRGKNVVINTGSRARLDDTPGLSASQPLTHVEALEVDRAPEHLIVLGGGYVGLELAQALRRLGSRVTVVERNGALLHREDPDVTEAVGQLFRDEGIDVRTGTAVQTIEGKSGETVRLQTTSGALEGTHLLVAGGRTPNTDGIGLDLAGVELNGQGHVKVDERRRTSAAGVWAVGDCAGGPYFTHISADDFRVVLDNLAGGNRVTTGRQVPFCLFTDPELARIGLSEREARERGIPYRLAKLPMAHVLRTHTLSEPRGFMKALVEKDGDRVLGFTAFGPEAGEIMTTVQVVIAGQLPFTVLRDAVIAHPTMAEGLGDLFAGVPA
ncbi:mercuric reductase : Pyruvate/2-oxoglutarate dehydrogenase complex, dihydrolipoamide dehydrogenase component OS=Singulisphaera acidiphila (strain ATCC BAA-1392 / DSM 18658 / VKM B-2454 / MOB10) GN=Sinac_3751 PE=4 SV=1: Pyr_redox_2: Pyr_redox: Pyr_redox_dim [Gemmata massiliana]|uniref:Mercuric reductase n=1 Tax=Gemmata massiliana TaxID=1210884 RepID=A0A6P2D9G0_9BACT|nr:FAD-dependent oxidoreductase [Gemmata massiliana]VTR96120.1 mercuric reductase : Pyruvate/2-oxoglutarate dehydrogenase complex, dihydrolipoamide dehydrogenase component OS=Singulisphaera acidiphila (strain ATCC BAA-1392 / DSM 18658 / VKM B-2454 / MOB10) GN=Sinac_3751 PE=4 SV=1: Pyr_redox_2: Pyr_redox: Pyr_redox_dim [Gemmata massiliana]